MKRFITSKRKLRLYGVTFFARLLSKKKNFDSASFSIQCGLTVPFLPIYLSYFAILSCRDETNQNENILNLYIKKLISRCRSWRSSSTMGPLRYWRSRRSGGGVALGRWGFPRLSPQPRRGSLRRRRVRGLSGGPGTSTSRRLCC